MDKRDLYNPSNICERLQWEELTYPPIKTDKWKFDKMIDTMVLESKLEIHRTTYDAYDMIDRWWYKMNNRIHPDDLDRDHYL